MSASQTDQDYLAKRQLKEEQQAGFVSWFGGFLCYFR